MRLPVSRRMGVYEDLTAANHVSHRHPPYSVVMSALTAMVRDRSVVADTADIANANGISALLVTPRLSIAPYTEARVARTLQGEPTSLDTVEPARRIS